MKHTVILVVLFAMLLLSACQTEVCPPGSCEHVADPAQFPSPISAVDTEPSPTPSLVEIRGKMVEVDRVIHGPLCNDAWSGTIYVACDVQVVEWTEEEGPYFLDGCELDIEPGTVVYVAAHNDAAYYKGCAACHNSSGGVE